MDTGRERHEQHRERTKSRTEIAGTAVCCREEEEEERGRKKPVKNSAGRRF